MALPKRKAAETLTGHAKPRIGPPEPARTDVASFRETAESLGITLMPWQVTAAKFLTAQGRDKRLLYREVCIVVARQNGKTTLMKPHIIRALKAGKRITHIAQTRELPRDMFGLIADALSNEPDLFPKRRGRTIWPRFGAGQEEIALQNGGSYRIAASNRGGGRGWPNDLVIIDELREQRDFLTIAAAEPTLTMSPDPQFVYLSNMGDEGSVVLNSVRERADSDPNLAYLEWSAASDRDPGDRVGWAEANPALGHYPSVLRTLEGVYAKRSSEGYAALFETEHLCRPVVTYRESVVDPATWSLCRGPVSDPSRPSMAVSMDGSGKRASAAIAWQQPDGAVAVRVIANVLGDPVDVETLGKDWKAQSVRLGVPEVAFDPWTDADLARHFRKSKPIIGRDWANASENFARLAESRRLRWADDNPITDDLPWTARKPHESGAWMAQKAQEDHPITAVLAAIRAVWLASGPRPSAPRFM